MARPANISLVKQILTTIAIKENSEQTVLQVDVKQLNTNTNFVDNVFISNFEKISKTFDEPDSALLPKKHIRCTNHLHLNVITAKSQDSTESYSTTNSNNDAYMPDSALIIKKGKKLFADAEETAFLDLYERAEQFLDESDMKIVEPGVETKVRKHIKIFSSSLTGLDQNPESPLYAGSPSLKNIADSSLLARRFSSAIQSPLSNKSATGEESPLSLSKASSLNHTSPIPQKMSKFGEVSRKNSIDVIFEEEKMQYNFHVPSENEVVRTRSKDINSIYISAGSAIIHEVMEPSTPLLDPALLKNNSSTNPMPNDKTERENQDSNE